MNPAVWRQKAKKTLAEVAGLVGCSSPTTVQRWERGEREVPNSVALAYASASNGEVTAEDLNKARQAYLAGKRTKSRRAARREPRRQAS